MREEAIAFGPVPSRRLGRSLGINNIPAKHCSYGCRYCQVGPTHQTSITPREFYTTEALVGAVETHLERARQRREAIDYLTFVPDGEPTLDRHLTAHIQALQPFGLQVAVISNASLLWRPEVRDALAAADWVSVKVDSVDPARWRHINRPHPELELSRVLAGIETFAAGFGGKLVSETMLLAGVNDDDASLAAIGGFLARLPLQCAYIGVPIRPTTDPEARPPAPAVLTRAHEALSSRLERVELLISDEGDSFAATGDAAADILSISAVHPLREAAVNALLTKNSADWSCVEHLLERGELQTVEYNGKRFYIRRWHAPGEMER